MSDPTYISTFGGVVVVHDPSSAQTTIHKPIQRGAVVDYKATALELADALHMAHMDNIRANTRFAELNKKSYNSFLAKQVLRVHWLRPLLPSAIKSWLRE